MRYKYYLFIIRRLKYTFIVPYSGNSIIFLNFSFPLLTQQRVKKHPTSKQSVTIR